MSTMPIKDNTYASLLSGNRIRYVPSCLVLQMILKFSSRLSMMNAGGGLETLCPDLTAFVRQLTVNILHTANAYKNRGSMLFPGDWKSDCPRIRKVFHDILARVGDEGEFRISSTQINEFHEARLMAKFDQSAQLPGIFRTNKLSILQLPTP